MKEHFINQYTKNEYCGIKQLYLRHIAKEFKDVTCRTCKELHEVMIGKRSQLSFGGDLDKNGKERKNKGRNK